MPSSLRPTDHIHASAHTPRGLSIQTKVAEYELQNVLQAMNVLIPNAVVIDVYNQLNKAKGTKGNSFSITEIKSQVNKSAAAIEDNIKRSCRKKLFADRDFYFVLLFFCGGIFSLAAFIGYNQLKPEAISTLVISNTLCFFLSAMKSVILIPLEAYRVKSRTRKHTEILRKFVLAHSAAYTADITSAFDHQLVNNDSVFVNLLTYIEKKVYDGNPYGFLTKRDLDQLLLSAIGNDFDAQAADEIMALVDTDKVSVNARTDALHPF